MRRDFRLSQAAGTSPGPESVMDSGRSPVAERVSPAPLGMWSDELKKVVGFGAF